VPSLTPSSESSESLDPLAEGSETLATLAEGTETLTVLEVLTGADTPALPAMYPSLGSFPSLDTFPSEGTPLIPGTGLSLSGIAAGTLNLNPLSEA